MYRRAFQNSRTIKLFSCNANIPLAEEVAKNLGTSLGLSEVSRFSDGEIRLKIDEAVRESNVFIIQSTSTPANEHLMELLIMIDAAKRASAGIINAVMPYFGYARQDRKTRARDPISAKLVADLIMTAGADRIVTMDLHSAQIQGFFNIPVDNLVGMPLFYDYFVKKFGNMEDVVVVSPDFGSVQRARAFAEKLNVPLAIIDKRRPKPNVSEVMNIIGGDVEGKKVLILDDLIDTAGTIVNAAAALKERGAAEIYASATHGILSGEAVQRVADSAITEMVFTNTVNIPEEKLIDKIHVISVSELFAEAISRINNGLPVSPLFK